MNQVITSGKRVDYVERIREPKNRFTAANMVRAFGCQLGAISTGPEDALAVVKRSESHAQALERDMDPDQYERDESGAGYVHPFKKWLREWGYLS